MHQLVTCTLRLLMRKMKIEIEGRIPSRKRRLNEYTKRPYRDLQGNFFLDEAIDVDRYLLLDNLVNIYLQTTVTALSA